MSGKPPAANPAAKVDLSNCIRSSFTLTFAIEIIDLDLWTDHKEGNLNVGPSLKNIKLQYQLYYGSTFEVDVAIHEHVSRVICNESFCWIRAWMFLERRWMTFSIRHAAPVRAMDFRNYDVEVNISPASAFTGMKQDYLYFPPLDFRQRRQFGDVIEKIPAEMEVLVAWIREWLWNSLLDYIPSSPLDGPFNLPFVPTDIRHQDLILSKVQDAILKDSQATSQMLASTSTKHMAKPAAKKTPKKGFCLALSGDKILAGTGRLVTFEPVGDRPTDLGEIILIMSTDNLPAPDDIPITFINVGNLYNAPLEEFRKLNISHLYTRWILGDETHDSKQVDINSLRKSSVNFKDSHAVPLNIGSATEVTAIFLDNLYSVQLRGVKNSELETEKEAKLFGYEKQDRDYGVTLAYPLKIEEECRDFLIAVTKIDTRTLARGLNSFLTGEHSLYPPRQAVPPLSRQGACTNDINLIREPQKPDIIVPASLVLSEQMSLEVSLGVVGCKPPKITSCFSRLFCITRDSNATMEILVSIRKLNDELSAIKPSAMLTGFALDSGEKVMLYLEGPRDGNILKIWDMTEEFYPKVKPIFSTSARYTGRIYPEFLEAIMPFVVLKLFAPLSLVLACPSVYARPALPIPTRIAALKFGRLMQCVQRLMPSRSQLPTAAELRSFRLEMCTPPRAYPILHTTHEKASVCPRQSRESVSNLSARINWEKK